MKHNVKAMLMGGLLLFLGMYTYLLWGSEQREWKNWQNHYFQIQMEELKKQIQRADDSIIRADLMNQMDRFQQKKPEVVNLMLPNGRVERCQSCHLGIEEISPSHPIESFGCTVCHGGNPLALDREIAHTGMYGEGHPGQLQVSRQSCGGTNSECHTGHDFILDNQVDLVAQSLMATKGSELSMVRYIFGFDVYPHVIAQNGQTAQGLSSPFDGKTLEPKLRENCLSQCHLSQGQLTEQAAAANGCETCHVLSNGSHTYQGEDVTIPQNETGHGLSHQLTIQIPYKQCNQCHNQGMPDLYTMDFNMRSDLQTIKATGAKDGDLEVRKQSVYQPGFVYTLCEVKFDCIDCHSRQEVMGDGHSYASEYDALKVQCKDCHGTKSQAPKTWIVSSKEDIAYQQELINPLFPELRLGAGILVTEKGEELPYVREDQGEWFLYRKVTSGKYRIPLVLGSECRQEQDKQTSNDCHKCHDVSGNLKK